MSNILRSPLCVPVLLLSYLTITRSHVTSCSDKHYNSDEEDGDPCSGEESGLTPQHVLLGVVIAITSCLIVFILWCLCCIVPRRRRALREAVAARDAEMATISRGVEPSGNRDQVPSYPAMTHQSQYSTAYAPRYPPPVGQVTPYHQQDTSDAQVYKVAPSAPPVYPDEPPPKYKP